MLVNQQQSFQHTTTSHRLPKEHALKAPPLPRPKQKRPPQNTKKKEFLATTEMHEKLMSETATTSIQQQKSKKMIDTENTTTTTMHVVFSTSCHIKQDWQSYLFFYQAMAKNQTGTVTRLVSGCTPDQERTLKKDFQEKIAIMSPSSNFRIHFTPEYGRRFNPKEHNFHKTKYWNKPFGLRHWLEHEFGYNFTAGTLSIPAHDDDVIVLVDPDMLIQRPFQNYFPEYLSDLWKEGNDVHLPKLDKVSHGSPMAQSYGFGSQWLKNIQSNLTYVVGEDSPVDDVSMAEAATYYPAGPPYIVTARDMYQISYYWTKFLPKIFKLYPEFMSEMYGYSTAAAHLRLPHQLAKGFMVSDINSGSEGWSFMNNADETVCKVEQFQDKVPQVIHFCQRYSIGEFFLSKYKLPVEILSCDQPMLELPPLNIAVYTNHSRFGDGTVTVWKQSKDQLRKKYQNTYMICSLMPAINNAAKFFKDHHCPNGANYNQTWNSFTTDQKLLKKQLAAAAVN